MKDELDKVYADVLKLDKTNKKWLKILKEFEVFLNGTIGKWKTTSINLEVNPGYKPFNTRYYMVTNTNKDTLFKDVQSLVDIGVLTHVQKLQYDMSIFIMPKKEYTARFTIDDWECT